MLVTKSAINIDVANLPPKNDCFRQTASKYWSLVYRLSLLSTAAVVIPRKNHFLTDITNDLSDTKLDFLGTPVSSTRLKGLKT